MVQIRREGDQGYGAFQGERRSLPARLKTQRGQQPGSWREASSREARVSFECSLYKAYLSICDQLRDAIRLAAYQLPIYYICFVCLGFYLGKLGFALLTLGI